MSKIKHSSKFLFFQILKNNFIFFCKYLPFTSKFKENLPRRKFEIKTILKFGIGSKISKIVFELVKGKQICFSFLNFQKIIHLRCILKKTSEPGQKYKVAFQFLLLSLFLHSLSLVFSCFFLIFYHLLFHFLSLASHFLFLYNSINSLTSDNSFLVPINLKITLSIEILAQHSI